MNDTPPARLRNRTHAELRVGDSAELTRQLGEADIAICGGVETKIEAVPIAGFAQMRIVLSNTNDNPEWQNTIRHIAIEGHCYFVNADLIFRRSDYPATASGQAEIAALPDIACRGGSCVIDPFGHDVSDTVWDEEAIIYADLDMQKVPASRMELDCVGHYARPDVLELHVHEK